MALILGFRDRGPRGIAGVAPKYEEPAASAVRLTKTGLAEAGYRRRLVARRTLRGPIPKRAYGVQLRDASQVHQRRYAARTAKVIPIWELPRRPLFLEA